MKILSIGIEGDAGGAMVAKRQMDRQLSTNNHSVHSIYLPNSHPAVPTPSSVFEIMRRCGEYDLIHCHSIVGSHALSAAIAAAQSDTPLIYHTQTSFLTDLSWREKYLLRSLLRFQTRFADDVVFVSELERQLLQSYISPRSRQHVVENRAGIDYSEINSLPADFADLDSPYLISVGTVSERKGQHRIVDALRHLSNLELVLVGHVENDIQARVSELGLHDRVHILGQIKHSTTQSLIANAEALLLLSTYESYGIVIVEALAHGVPVVCTDMCGAKSRVTADNGAVVPVDASTRTICLAIESTLELSPSPNDDVTDWENMVDRLEQIYQDCVREV